MVIKRGDSELAVSRAPTAENARIHLLQLCIEPWCPGDCRMSKSTTTGPPGVMPSQGCGVVANGTVRPVERDGGMRSGFPVEQDGRTQSYYDSVVGGR